LVSTPEPQPESIGHRIEVLRGTRTQAELASALGVSKNSIGRYERGERLPDIDFLERLADLCGVDRRQLIQIRVLQSREVQEYARARGTPIVIVSDENEAAFAPETGQRPVLPGYVFVPRYDVRAAAGPGALVSTENVLDYMAFRENWVRTLGVDAGRLVLITAAGDSMEPTIRAGDLLLIDTGVTRILDDAIYVIARGGELAVKRLQRFFRGAVSIRSDNPAYAEETLAEGEVDQLRVAGRVRWIGRMV
jgi:phage repressor protein C with HTH and peptisase S24 domain